MSNSSNAKKIATLALFCALSLIMFLIENLFPPMIIPGAKMGLANIFSFAALIIYGPLEAFIIVGVRTVLGAIIVGNVSALMYSFTGGVISMTISALLVYIIYPKISIMAVSILAAIAHNITQTAVFIFASSTVQMVSYMPYMALIGILSGSIIGGVTLLIFKKIPVSVFERALYKRTSGSK